MGAPDKETAAIEEDIPTGNILFSNIKPIKETSLLEKETCMEIGIPENPIRANEESTEKDDSSLEPWMIVERRKRSGPSQPRPTNSGLIHGTPRAKGGGPRSKKPYSQPLSNHTPHENTWTNPSNFHPGLSGSRKDQRPLGGLGKRARTDHNPKGMPDDNPSAKNTEEFVQDGGASSSNTRKASGAFSFGSHG